MTPKEKALEIFHKHYKMWTASKEDVVAHCIITVDEVIAGNNMTFFERGGYSFTAHTLFGGLEWWQEVKKEIEAM